MVEVWLQKLVDGMQGTVKSTIKRAYRNVQEMALEDFIFGHPAQIALLGIQFQWTADTQVRAPLSLCMVLWVMTRLDTLDISVKLYNTSGIVTFLEFL